MAENVFYVVYSVDLTLVNLKLEGNLSYDYETGVNSFLMILSDSTFTLWDTILEYNRSKTNLNPLLRIRWTENILIENCEFRAFD